MQTTCAEISVRGRIFNVPATRIDGRTIVVKGNWIKTASIHDEEWQAEGVDDPDFILAKLREQGVKADLFTFAQKLPETKPKFNYHLEWDNLAAISLTTYKEWWEKRLPQETRKNVRRAERRGVVVRAVDFDEALAAGIKSIYDETPIRQGRRFWHYGKTLEAVRRENSSYLDRSEFIGAYYQEQLIGFIKMVYVGKVSILMQIVSRNEHYDKRPTNALLAKAVEVSESKGMGYVVYGSYVYGKNNDAPLTEFKRRNGFEEILLPRYYIALTAKGSACLSLNLHRGLRRLLPKKLDSLLLRARARMYQGRMSTAGASANENEAGKEAGKQQD